jgi:hypothetical protein
MKEQGKISPIHFGQKKVIESISTLESPKKAETLLEDEYILKT